MAEVSNYKRRADLKAALRRAKPDDFLELEHVALIWGTTKQRFVTVRNAMADFPEPLPGQGNKYVYPARKAIEAMLNYETRHDDAAKLKAERTAKILGRGGSRKGAKSDAATYTVNELATLTKMRAEIEELEWLQGTRSAQAEVAVVVGEAFSHMSEALGRLPNKCDPHGLFPAELRAQIEAGGAELLMELHGILKNVMSPDAKPRGNRTSSNRSRRTRARS